MTLNSFPLRECNWLHLSLSTGTNVPESLSQRRMVGAVGRSLLSSVKGLILSSQSGLTNFRCFFSFFFFLTDWFERGKERQRNTDLFFHLLMHSLVASCMCPDQGLNPQLWRLGTTPQPSYLARAESVISEKHHIFPICLFLPHGNIELILYHLYFL